MSPDVKRRAIFHALSDFFEGDELLEVMYIWENRFANRAQFVINEFIDVFISRISNPTRRSTIIKRIAGCLMEPDIENWPDPAAALAAYRKRRERARRIPSDHVAFHAFKTIFNCIEAELAGSEFEALRDRLIQSLYLTELNFTNRSQVMQWFKSKKANPSLTEEEARSLLHQLYLVMCDCYGPVRADKILSRSVATADQHLQGTGSSASKLLV